MKKNFLLAMLAVLLVFGLTVTSCDNGTTSSVAVIPGELQGIYKASGYTIRINANGKGSVNGTSCTFNAANNVLTIKMGTNTCTVDYAVGVDGIKFENVDSDSAVLEFVLTKFADASPIEKEIVQQSAIPAALVGTWNLVNALSEAPSFSAGTDIFVINADGSGSVRAADDNSYPAAWSVTGNKLKLTWYTLVCTFTWNINSTTGYLALSSPQSADGNALEGYADWGPFENGSGGTGPNISDFTWSSSIPANLIGYWAMDTYPLFAGTIFTITTDGTGYVFSGSIGGAVPCTYKTAAGGKLLLDVPGFGSCMYDYLINGGGDVLNLDGPVLAADATSALAGYQTAFGPFHLVTP